MTPTAQVLQVVILRDGLLLGTEVFVPGQYQLGSASNSDLVLDDSVILKHHATLYFQSGRAAIQAATADAPVFVNGHKVSSCEVRAVDEIIVGPFTMKVRIMSQQKQATQAPPAEIQAILDPAKSSKQVTVISNRRANQTQTQTRTPEGAPTAEIPVSAVGHVIDEVEETRTENVAIPMVTVTPKGQYPDVSLLAITTPGGPTPTLPETAAIRPPPPPPPSAPTFKKRSEEIDNIKSMEFPLPNEARGDSIAAGAVKEKNGGPAHTAKLFIELYWDDEKQSTHSFSRLGSSNLKAQKNSGTDFAMLGFQVPAEFVIAEQQDDIFRLYVPPDCTVERKANDSRFYPVPLESLDAVGANARAITLGKGHAIRFSNAQNHSLVASVAEPLPAAKMGTFHGLPWLFVATTAICVGAFLTFAIAFSDPPEKSDFDTRNLNPISVKLIAPPKPDVKKKLLEKVEKLKKLEKKKEVAEKPKATQDTKRALKAVEKITAAPAMKQLLAAVDKMGANLGALKVKNDAKLSGILGKNPIANSGLGTVGLSGTGGSTKGSELLKGGGIGALGLGTVGKGSVGGTVTKAVSRNIGAQGSIDKDAVAKVINSHLHEVSGCYEKALLKTPGLSGKIVLEWQITTSGTVGFAKTKSSSMQSPAVEACILQTLKMWKFPAAQGAGVVITYPFMFNSVGY